MMKKILSAHFSTILFAVFVVIYLVTTCYFALYLEIYHNDSVARTANAFFTIFGRNPHLSAIGLVWLPLPSLLQIPLLLILRPFGLQGLSGSVATSILGALSVLMIYKIAILLEDGKRSFFTMLVPILYGLNPMILLSASIGLSETTFILALLFFSYFFLKWYKDFGVFDLVLAAFALVFALGSRYEAVACFAAGIVLVFVIELSRKKSFRENQGKITLLSLPFVYAFILWILVNWLIMGDPLYFMNSVYSNSSFTNALSMNSSLLENSYHSFIDSSLYVFKRILLLAPGLVLLPLVLVGFFKSKKETLDKCLLLMILLVPYFSILIFHAYQLYSGKSFGWLRFYIYAVVALTLMALYFVRYHKFLRYLVVVSLFVGIVTTAYAMGNYNYGKEENSFVRKIKNNSETLDYSRTYSDQKAVAAFMNEQTGKILLDTASGFAIPLFANNPEQYVITSDVDFQDILKNFRSKVDWVIIHDPKLESSTSSIINNQYPDMWDGEMSSVFLYQEIDSWRIYGTIHYENQLMLFLTF